MRIYSHIHKAFWTHPQWQDLSDNSRLLMIYLISGPQSNMLGCFRLPLGYVTADLNWPPDRVQQGFEELSQKGCVTWDHQTAWVWIACFLEWHPIENPNQGKGITRLFDHVPEESSVYVPLARALLHQTGLSGRRLSKPFRKDFTRVSKPGTGAGTRKGTRTGC